MKTILKLLIAPLLLLSLLATAQVETNFNSKILLSNQGRFVKPYKTEINFQVPAKNIINLLQIEKREREQSNEEKPFQLAIPVPIDLDIANQMNWKIDTGTAYGKFTIKLNAALSSSINFDRFYLPKGTVMYVYNENGNMITGPITEKENNSDKVWGSWVYRGPFLTIEIKTPLITLKQLILHSNNIAYGYKEVYKTKVSDFGTSGPCEINVLCPLGNGWEGERNSVALILSDNGSSWCSGSMIMNTCSTNRPFFLTANHCFNPPGLPQQNVSAWRFTFQAWSPTCNPSQNANGVTYNGSTLRANWTNSDFCLVELNNTLPTNSGINYAGWTRSGVPAQNATGIHHPHGDVMKISRANNAVTRTGYFGAGNDHWQANWSAQNNGAGQIVTPVTEPGSSGSPLFDQNHRIVGQLHGGPSSCGGAQLWDFYGSFDVSWTGGGTNATRLSNWLDPNNSGAITTNTTNIANLTNVSPALTISGSDFCTSTTYTVNAPAGTTVVWSATSGIVNINSATGYATKVSDGSALITATIPYCGGAAATVSKRITVGVPNNYYIQRMSFVSPYRLDIYPSFSGYQLTATSWNIYVDGSFSTSGSGNPPSVISVYASCGSHTITLTTYNSCGSYSTSSTYSGSGCYAITPNPANGNVTITDMAASSNSASPASKAFASPGGKITITVFDNTNRALKQFNFTQSSHYNFSVANLTPGTYIVQIKQNGSVNTLKLIKQ